MQYPAINWYCYTVRQVDVHILKTSKSKKMLYFSSSGIKFRYGKNESLQSLSTKNIDSYE